MDTDKHTQGKETNQLWFRIANLRPQIRDHVSVHRHEYRGEIWYVYQDHTTNRFHRFDYSAHQFISLMNGERCVQDILGSIESKNNGQVPDKEEIFLLLGQLHRSDLLQTNTQPETEELYQRAHQQQKQRWKLFLKNPISFRVSLFDPERLLTYALPIVKPLFSWVGFSLWLLTLFIAIIFTSSYWSELSSNSIEQALLPNNILLLALIYPFIKLLHELGHAFAVKFWGGEVHEIGIIFVLLIPIPYVDASGSSAFSFKRQRIAVGAAGIMVEIFLACIALFVWLGVEPGLVSTISLDIMLIAGVSTLFFNGNPLLRYDGYYVLADMIGIPNLASRSNKYIGYLTQRYIFGIPDASSPAYDSGERYWFFCYSPTAYLYRISILTIIVLLVADEVFLIGAILGFWVLYNQLILPLLKHTKFVFTHPKTSRNRPRAIATSSMMVIFVFGFLFALPLPLVTVSQGVVWLPENARIHAGTAGFVKKILIETDSLAVKGIPLIALEDPLQQARLKILDAKLQELNFQYKASWPGKRVQSKIIEKKILSLKADIEQANIQSKKLIIRSPSSGKIIIPNYDDMKGRFLEQGDFVAYVVSPSKASARVVIKQEDMGLLSKINNIYVKFANNMTENIPASITRIIPEASHQLPSAAFGTTGGGNFTIEPSETTGLTAVDKLQQIEIELDTNNHESSYIGKRIYVRFDHGTATIAQQWYKSLQQLFLRRFSV